MTTRAPVSLEEAKAYFSQWKNAFDDALREYMKTDKTTDAVNNAALTANAALAKIVEEHDGRIVFPRPRLSFDGKNPYPKDLGLIVYGEKPGYETWRWRP